MVFSSLFFLYQFFPLCLLLYFILPNIKLKNLVLLVFSLYFYSWGEPVYIVLLLFSSTLDYINGLLIEKYRGHWKSKAALLASVIINLSLLGFFKYSGFLVENFNLITGLNVPIPAVKLPIGISFYTFQTLSYVIDLYKNKTEVQRSLINYILYVSMFPQLIAGPIVRYADVARQINNRKTTLEGFSAGITRFLTGLGKKVLIANVAGKLASNILNGNLMQISVVESWLGMILYAFQIYFDFSGYSDMAIGLGKIFGFHYLENFNYPYISKSITEFWRRWHISLSTVFRDYVYIPLGGNRKYQIRNLFIVWFLTGFWHGASWNFIFWGLFYFVFLVIEKFFLYKILERIPAVFSRLYSLLIVLTGWVFFYFTDMKNVLHMLKTMFFLSDQPVTTSKDLLLISNNAVFFIAAIIACTPIAVKVKSFLEKKASKSRNFEFCYFSLKAVYNLSMLLICTAALVGSSYNPFLYFRF